MKNLRLFICLLFGTFTFAQNKVDVYFDFNGTKPNATSQKVLNDWIKNHPNVEVYQISGFCDTVASTVYNKKLAADRINSIEKILKSNKITIVSSVKKIIYGEEFEKDEIVNVHFEQLEYPLDWEIIFSKNVKYEKRIEKVSNSDWSYYAYGKIIKINPILADFGDIFLEIGNWTNDPNVIGEYIYWKIDRLDIRRAK